MSVHHIFNNFDWEPHPLLSGPSLAGRPQHEHIEYYDGTSSYDEIPSYNDFPSYVKDLSYDGSQFMRYHHFKKKMMQCHHMMDSHHFRLLITLHFHSQVHNATMKFEVSLFILVMKLASDITLLQEIGILPRTTSCKVCSRQLGPY